MNDLVENTDPQFGVEPLYNRIRKILINGKQRAYHAVNFSMVDSYWLIGQQIVEHEQHGEKRASYGKGILRELSERLTIEFGKGLDERELRKMRQFYLLFRNRDTLRPELTWSHYRRLISIEQDQIRLWYMNEAADSAWSTRQMDRQISTLYYERLLASRDKASVKAEAEEKLSASECMMLCIEMKMTTRLLESSCVHRKVKQ